MMCAQMFDVCYTKADQSYPHRFTIYDNTGMALKSDFLTKESAEQYLNLCKNAELITRDEEYYQYKKKNDKIEVTAHQIKKYYLYNKEATKDETQRDLYYKDPENNQGILMEVYDEEVGKALLKKFQDTFVKQNVLHLPVNLRCLFDDFANIGEIPGFNERLATMRTYWISCTIVLQSFAQLKEKYDKLAEAVIGNCDSKVFFGAPSSKTDKYMIEKVGEISGSFSHFFETSHTLVDTVDINKLDPNNCIVFVRGYKMFDIEKYRAVEHPNYHLTGYANEEKLVTERFLDEHYLCLPKEEFSD